MKTISVNVYKLNELSPDIRKAVIEKSSQVLVDSDWYSPIIEGFKEDLIEYGIENPEAYFSGFYSQGDGACFVCDTIDTDIFIRKLYQDGYDISQDAVIDTKNMNVIIQKTGSSFARQYDHESTVASEINYEGDRLLPNDIEHLESVITEWVREKCKKLYSDLEDFYEELTGEISVAEYLSDVYFFDDGRIADKYVIQNTLE